MMESDDAVTKGGHKYTLPDQIRLQNYLYTMIQNDYPTGASISDIKNELIKMELDNFKDEYTVPERRKLEALTALVASNQMYLIDGTKKKPKHYIANTTNVCNGLVPNMVSQDSEGNANNRNEINLNDLHELSQQATTVSNPLEQLPLEESSKDIGEMQQKVRVIRKAYTKRTAHQILQAPSTQECLNSFGYITVGSKIFNAPSASDEGTNEVLLSACRDIISRKTDKRSRERSVGNYITYDIDVTKKKFKFFMFDYINSYIIIF